MEIGSCSMLVMIGAGIIFSIPLFGYLGVAFHYWWNTPPSDPPSTPPSDPPSSLSKALRHMKNEMNRLGITLNRVGVVATLALLFTAIGWGGVSAYRNVTVVECGSEDADVAIKIPKPAERVVASACGCE